MDIVKYIISYTFAFIIANIVINYILHLPHKITGEPTLVNEYYIDNIKTSFVYDYFLILFYLCIAYVFIYLFDVHSFPKQIGVVTLTSFITTGIAITYILSQPKNDSFFSRLFHASKYNLTVNDVIIVVSTFILFTVSLDN